MATTVKELIERLQTLPPNIPVEVLKENSGWGNHTWFSWVDLELSTFVTADSINFQMGSGTLYLGQEE